MKTNTTANFNASYFLFLTLFLSAILLFLSPLVIDLVSEGFELLNDKIFEWNQQLEHIYYQ